MTKINVGYHMSHTFGTFGRQEFYSNSHMDPGNILIVISGNEDKNTNYYLEGSFQIDNVETNSFKRGGKNFKYCYKLSSISVTHKPILLNETTGLSGKDVHKYYSNGTGISVLRSEHQPFINVLLAENAEPSIREDIQQTEANETISPTQKKLLIDARLGQGKFRQDVMKLWDNVCAVTGLSTPAMLVASHIKPWKVSNDTEKLLAENGILLHRQGI